MRRSLHDRHLGAEAVRRLRQLHARRAAAEDDQPAADRLHGGRLAGAPDALELATCTASPGRRSVLEGMHAHYEHSPPTRSRSTTATRSPPSASAPAQCSPGAPAPSTMTS